MRWAVLILVIMLLAAVPVLAGARSTAGHHQELFVRPVDVVIVGPGGSYNTPGYYGDYSYGYHGYYGYYYSQPYPYSQGYPGAYGYYGQYYGYPSDYYYGYPYPYAYNYGVPYYYGVPTVTPGGVVVIR